MTSQDKSSSSIRCSLFPGPKPGGYCFPGQTWASRLLPLFCAGESNGSLLAVLLISVTRQFHRTERSLCWSTCCPLPPDALLYPCLYLPINDHPSHCVVQDVRDSINTHMQGQVAAEILPDCATTLPLYWKIYHVPDKPGIRLHQAGKQIREHALT
jgi:hypothetical protein